MRGARKLFADDAPKIICSIIFKDVVYVIAINGFFPAFCQEILKSLKYLVNVRQTKRSKGIFAYTVCKAR